MYSKELYKILGVSEKATAQEIKEGFYKRAKEYHPDLNKDNPNAQKKFVEATNAYEILRDAKKKEMYDLGRRGPFPSWEPSAEYRRRATRPQTGRQWQQQQQQQQQQYEQPDFGGRGWPFAGGGAGGGGAARQSDFNDWFRGREHVFNDFEDLARMFRKMQEEQRRGNAAGGQWNVYSTPGNFRMWTWDSGSPNQWQQQQQQQQQQQTGTDFGLGGTFAGLAANILKRIFGNPFEGEQPHTWEGKENFDIKTKPLEPFPRVFEMGEASPVFRASAGDLIMDINGNDRFLGRIDSVNAPPNALHFYRPNGVKAIIAQRTIETSDKRQADPAKGFGEVITLTDARSKRLLGTIVEHAPFRSSFWRWLNYFSTKYVIHNEQRKEEIFVRKRNALMFGTYFSGIEMSNGQPAVAFSAPPKLFRWRYSWNFQQRFGGDEEAWAREMRDHKGAPSVHPVFYSFLAAFHTLDIKTMTKPPTRH